MLYLKLIEKYILEIRIQYIDNIFKFKWVKDILF